MKRLQYRIEALLVRAMLWLLRRLGPAGASNLGGFLARSLGPLLPVTRTGDANLRLAMPELDAAARRRILRGVWDNLGRTAAELPHIARLERTDSGPGWEIEGAGIVEELARAGGPSILFSAHIGNWELLPKAAGTFGIKMSSFYRAASNPEVDALIMQLRTAGVGPGVPNFAKGSQGARAALAYLGRGGHLGMLVDQKMNDGIAAPFFGRMAMTAPAAAAFALRYRCPVIPGHVERIGPARLRLVVEPPLALPDSGDRQADLLSLTTQMNTILERWIRARPGEWLWLHRRWPKEG
jgi:KDO2-lipid IV(A) lauroyltransferase